MNIHQYSSYYTIQNQTVERHQQYTKDNTLFMTLLHGGSERQMSDLRRRRNTDTRVNQIEIKTPAEGPVRESTSW